MKEERMNYNLISYIIYIFITVYITIIVGYQCYKNGSPYVKSIFLEDEIAHSVNNILLVGYYLTNIGYAVTIISYWNKIYSLSQMINELSLRIASILFILAAMHYMNIVVLSLFRRSSIKNKL